MFFVVLFVKVEKCLVIIVFLFYWDLFGDYKGRCCEY